MTTVDVMLKEYDEIRAEITKAIERRVSLLQYGATAVGGVLAAGVAALGELDDAFSWSAIAILAPSLAWMLLFVWIGEYERTQRAGAYVKIIEDKVNAELQKNALGWESYLLGQQDGKSRHMIFPYAVQCVFVTLFTIACFAFAVASVPGYVPAWQRLVPAIYIVLGMAALWRVYDAHSKGPAAAAPAATRGRFFLRMRVAERVSRR